MQIRLSVEFLPAITAEELENNNAANVERYYEPESIIASAIQQVETRIRKEMGDKQIARVNCTVRERDEDTTGEVIRIPAVAAPTPKPVTIIEGLLSEDWMGYKKGAKAVRCVGDRYGLLLCDKQRKATPELEVWGYALHTSGFPPLIKEKPCTHVTTEEEFYLLFRMLNRKLITLTDLEQIA